MPGRPTALAYSRARGLLCLQQVRDGWAVFLCVLSSRPSYLSFSNASSLG